MRRTVFLAATFVVGATGSARAESRSVRVDYAADASCPDERRFVELSRDRVKEWATIDEHGELVVRARAERQDGVFIGRLSLEDAAGTSLGGRSIQDADCEEVVVALSLFLAVALEAEASHARAPATTVAEPPASPPVTEARPPADLPEPRAPRSPLPRSNEASAISWQLVARAHGITGRMPDAVPGAALAVDLGPKRRPSIVRPYGSVGIDLAPYSEHREGRGHIDLGWGAVFARACVGFDLADRTKHTESPFIEPWACARAEGGGLRAASRGYAVNRTAHLPWYAAGVEAGVSLRLSQIFSVGAFAHAAAPLVRHELVLGDLRVFRAPVVTGEAGLELKIRIW